MIEHVCGIDYSIGGPAICVHPKTKDWSVNNCRFAYITGTKCRQKTFNYGDITFKGFAPIKEYEYDIERFKHNSILFIQFMLEYSVKNVLLEGYAYGAKGRAVFNIGENTGLLKFFLHSQAIKYIAETPPVIKKFATGKGNAGKDDMVFTFLEETNIDLIKLFGSKSPANDIVDSYYMCKLLHNNTIINN